jgi:hypothetical protein
MDDKPMMIGGGVIDDGGHVTTWNVPISRERAQELGIPFTLEEWQAFIAPLWQRLEDDERRRDHVRPAAVKDDEDA